MNGLQHANKSEMQMQPRSDTELQMTDNKQEKETPVLMQTGIVSVCKALLQRHAMPDGAGYADVKERTSAGRLAAVRTVLDDETEEADRLCELPDASKAKLWRASQRSWSTTRSWCAQVCGRDSKIGMQKRMWRRHEL